MAIGLSTLAAQRPGWGVSPAPDGSFCVRIAVVGDIDLSVSGWVGAEIIRLLRLHQPERPVLIEVDLADVGFLDCSGVRTLLRCQTLAAQMGCSLTLVNPQPAVHRVLEVLDLLALVAPATPRRPAATSPVGPAATPRSPRSPSRTRTSDVRA